MLRAVEGSVEPLQSPCEMSVRCRGAVEGFYSSFSLLPTEVVQLSLQHMAPPRPHWWGRTDSRTLAWSGLLVVPSTALTVLEHVGGILTSVVAKTWSKCIVTVVSEGTSSLLYRCRLYSNLYRSLHL